MNRWRCIAGAIAAGMLLAGGAAAETGADAHAALDRRLRAVMQAWRLTGMSVAAIADDRVVFQQGYGVRSAAQGGAVDGNTMFQLASMSKPLSSALIATFVEEGRLAWGDRVVDRLPWFRVADPEVTAELRLDDLLSHRSGVEATNWLLDVPGLRWRQSVQRLQFLPQQAPPRSVMRYDNFMFAAGGLMLVEAGEDYAAALQRRLFAPLGMTRSLGDFERVIAPAGLAACHECELPASAPGPAASLASVANVALPHVRTGDGPAQAIHWRHLASLPASSGVSSAADMARFARMILNGGSLDGTRVLRPDTVATLLLPHSKAPPAAATAIDGFAEQQRRVAEWVQGYALGWYTSRYAGIETRHHGGGLLGVAGTVILVPERKVAVVVLNNDRLYNSGHVLAAAYSMLDVLLGLPAVDWIGYQQALDRRATAAIDATADAPLAAAADPGLAGRYCHPAYGDIRVTNAGQSLAVSQGPQRRGKLLPLAAGGFSLRWDGPRRGGRPARFEGDALVIDGMRFVRCAAAARP